MSTERGARLRASDAEREEYATIVRAAMTEGRLDLAEGEERLAAAYAATYRDELAPLTADLPGGGRAALARTPQARAAARRALLWHATFVAVVGAILVGAWVLSHAQFFWPIIPLAILAIGFARHARFRRYGHWHGAWSGPGRHAPPWARS